MSRPRPGLALWLLLVLAPLAGAQDALSAARALYAAAQYDDALRAFDAMKSRGALAPEAALAVDLGRAYCLLALDRNADAQAAIAAVVDLDPSFLPGEDDTAPKLRNAFREGRRRALPDAVDRLYAQAKSAYDGRNTADAARGFSRVLSLLDDPDLSMEPGPREERRKATADYLSQARAALAAAPAIAVARDATPAAAGTTPPPPQSAQIFDASAADVAPPVPIETPVNVPNAFATSQGGAVVVELVVSARGTVESAAPRPQSGGAYTASVIRAVLGWRYKPATRAGKPVRYRMLVRVVIPPRGG